MLSISKIKHNRLLIVVTFIIIFTAIMSTSIQVYAQDNKWTFEYKGGGHRNLKHHQQVDI